jgi:hypothetical protein
LDHGQIAILDVQVTPAFRCGSPVDTLSKVLSPAAQAFRYDTGTGRAVSAGKFAHHLVLP